jgi:hypothetical protein
MEKESPYLLWLSEQEKADALFQIVRFKKPGSTTVDLPKDLRRDFITLHRSYSNLVRKLEYVSYIDQDSEEKPLNKVRFKQNRTNMNQITDLCDRFTEENPEKDLNKTTVEELFYWYYCKHREGVIPVKKTSD